MNDATKLTNIFLCVSKQESEHYCVKIIKTQRHYIVPLDITEMCLQSTLNLSSVFCGDSM